MNQLPRSRKPSSDMTPHDTLQLVINDDTMNRIKDAVMERLGDIVQVVPGVDTDRRIKLDARYEADSDLGFGEPDEAVAIMSVILADEIKAKGVTQIVDLNRTHILINPESFEPFIGFMLRVPGDAI